MLAPLLDKMVTWNIKERFTASEALGFFEDMYPQLTLQQLESRPPPDFDETRGYTNCRWTVYDRWKGLPEDFVRQWSSFRIPKPPFMMRLLRWVCGYQWGHLTILWLRRLGKWAQALIR